jgi:uncharacterized damage-inducible protein DinB
MLLGMDSCERIFLDHSARKLRQHAGRIEDCLGRLTQEQVWARATENENAIGNLVLHLCGNVRQWIVSGVGGQADVRQRDAEFAARGDVKVADLAAHLRGLVDEAVAVIEPLPSNRLAEQLTVQGYHLTILEAVYSVVEHFSGHTGQIIFATKLLTGEDLKYYTHLRATKPHVERTP